MSQVASTSSTQGTSLIARMSRSEKFNLVLAIIGLVADTIGIGIFTFGLVRLEGSSANSSGYGVQVGIVLLTAGVLLYSWFGIGWYFLRRFAKMRIKTKPRHFTNAFFSACVSCSAVAGGATTPAWFMWLAFASGDPGAVVLIILLYPVVWALTIPAFYFFMPMVYEDMMPYLDQILASGDSKNTTTK